MHSYANNPALRSHLETQVDFFTELTHRSYDTLSKLSELNMRLARQLIDDTVDTSRDLLACANPFQLGATAMRHFEPVVEHLRSYQRDLVNVMSNAQVDLSRAAETHLPEAGRSAAAMAEQAALRTAELADAFGSRQNTTHH